MQTPWPESSSVIAHDALIEPVAAAPAAYAQLDQMQQLQQQAHHWQHEQQMQQILHMQHCQHIQQIQQQQQQFQQMQQVQHMHHIQEMQAQLQQAEIDRQQQYLMMQQQMEHQLQQVRPQLVSLQPQLQKPDQLQHMGNEQLHWLAGVLSGIPGSLRLLSGLDPAFLPNLSECYNMEETDWLGGGSSGSVARLRPKGSETEEHAVKVISVTQLQNDVPEEALRNEIASMVHLKHSHLVRILGLYLHPDPLPASSCAPPFLCFAMPRLEGNSLYDLVCPPKGHPQPERARSVAPQLFSALGYMHSQGFCHRDVWPGNIMIASDGHMTLLDFGCTSNYTNPMSGGNGTRQLNISYASPEAANAQLVYRAPWTGSPQQDCWAAGLVIAEICIGCLVQHVLGSQQVPVVPGHQAHQALAQQLETLCPGLARFLEPMPDWRLPMSEASNMWQQTTASGWWTAGGVGGCNVPCGGTNPSAAPSCQTPPALLPGMPIVYQSRGGAIFSGWTSRQTPDGWEVMLDAEDAEGRRPMTKAVAAADLWRITIPGRPTALQQAAAEGADNAPALEKQPVAQDTGVPSDDSGHEANTASSFSENASQHHADESTAPEQTSQDHKDVCQPDAQREHRADASDAISKEKPSKEKLTQETTDKVDTENGVDEDGCVGVTTGEATLKAGSVGCVGGG